MAELQIDHVRRYPARSEVRHIRLRADDVASVHPRWTVDNGPTRPDTNFFTIVNGRLWAIVAVREHHHRVLLMHAGRSDRDEWTRYSFDPSEVDRAAPVSMQPRVIAEVQIGNFDRDAGAARQLLHNRFEELTGAYRLMDALKSGHCDL
jgi:hypothetical protein